MGIRRTDTNGGVTAWNMGRAPRGYGRGLTPADVTADSPTVVWWLCDKCGHEWQAAVKDRVAGDACPKCRGVLS